MDDLVLDLHGKTWHEALEEFLDAYNASFAPRNSGGKRPGSPANDRRRLKIIHGYGSTGVGGVLLTRFRKLFQRHQDRLEFTPGEKLDNNPGYTMVKPLSPLPRGNTALAELVLEYCDQPRTISKISGEFRRFGDREVGMAVQSLESQRRLRKIYKSGHPAYQTT